MPFQIVLWEGDAYDTIGQWTDVDVQNKIKNFIHNLIWIRGLANYLMVI
jgi:hypothetical protein